LNSLSENDLFHRALALAQGLISSGTVALEVKSGYGLTTESELKMLRVIRRLGEKLPIPVKSTFLGAHAFPMAYRADRAAYIQLIL
jgi:imidazolonepropionase